MDYPAWCGLVRNAIYWVSGIDPCETRKGRIDEDDATTELVGLIGGWSALCESVGKEALTAADAIKTLEDQPAQHTDLRSILGEWSRDGKLPSTRAIGNHLKRLRGRVSGGKAFDFKTKDGNRAWFVKPVRKSDPGPQSGSSDSSDSCSAPRTEPENFASQSCLHGKSHRAPYMGGTQSHFSHLSHLDGETEVGEL